MAEIVTYRSVGADEFRDRLPEFIDVFADTLFFTPPYKGIMLHQGATAVRLICESEEDGFMSFFAEANNNIVAADLYNVYQSPWMLIGKEDVMDEVDRIICFLEKLPGDKKTVASESRLFTAPEFQGKGIASRLRRLAHSQLILNYSKPPLVTITGHESNNPKVINMSKKMGFSHTGVHINRGVGIPGYDYYWKYL